MNDIRAFWLKHGLKLIIGIKVFVFAGILNHYGYFIGEKSTSAQDASNQTPQASETEANQAATSDDSQEGPEEEERKLVSNRKSYLEDLLELPKIDSDNLKKREISRYLKILDRKHKQVQGRVSILEKREAQLKALEGSIDQKLKKLEEEIQFFDQTLQKEKKISQERLDQLVEYYQKMTPKKAAPVFEKMDNDLVVALFQNIPKKQTMNILSLMTPERSVELTEYFGRIRSGKEYELLKQINSSLRSEFQNCKGMPNQGSSGK